MLAYNLKLALKSLRRSPGLTALMVVTIALGIGVSTTTLTVFYLMSGDPIPHKSDQLHYVRLDNWINGSYGFRGDEEAPPEQITYRDAMSLLADAKGRYQSASTNTDLLIYPPDEAQPPEDERGRMVTADFFPMFDIPFKYGGPWDAETEEGKEPVVVLSTPTNEKLFGGEDSVGERLRIDDREFTVVGVIDDWLPIPKFYDVQGGQDFNDLERAFIPLSVGTDMELFKSSGNTSCPSESAPGYQGFLDSECIWIQYWVQLDTVADKGDYRAYLDAFVMAQKDLGRFPNPVNNRLHTVPEWLDEYEVVEEDAKVMVGLSYMFLIVCMLNAVGLLLDKFLGRPGHVAVHRALGASKPMMFRLHLVEVGIVGVAGGALGLAFALLGLQWVDKVYQGLGHLVELDPVMVATAMAVSFAATILAGLYPSWRSCQVAPAEHLRTQ